MDTEIQIKKTKVPRRLIHFSDGVVEEYSTDEEETKNIIPVKEAPVDLSKLNWSSYIWHKTFNILSTALSKADYCGEKLAWFFGITSPKYQYILDEHNRRLQQALEEKEFEDRERQADLARRGKHKILDQSDVSSKNSSQLDESLQSFDQLDAISKNSSQLDENLKGIDQLELSPKNSSVYAIEVSDVQEHNSSYTNHAYNTDFKDV